MKIESQHLEALARISVQEPRFIEWLQDRLVRHRDDAMNRKDVVEVRLAQGRGQELTEILKLMSDANEILRKADSRSSR